MLGNDVVDLRDPETSIGAAHPRFDERVFADVERERLRCSPSPARLRWTLWAAKESSFKAARKLDPLVVFSPARFVVQMENERQAIVSHGRLRFFVGIEPRADRVHAVALAALAPSAGLVAASVRIADADPSMAARRLAIDRLASRLAIDPASLTIARSGRIPVLLVDRRPSGVELSLSHHGAVIGFAAFVPPCAGRLATVDGALGAVA